MVFPIRHPEVTSLHFLYLLPLVRSNAVENKNTALPLRFMKRSLFSSHHFHVGPLTFIY